MRSAFSEHSEAYGAGEVSSRGTDILTKTLSIIYLSLQKSQMTDML